MTPPDLGTYTVDDRPNPGCELGFDGQRERAPRRRDVLPPTWGKGGIPTQDTVRGDDVAGTLAVMDTRPLEVLQTEQGLVKLPYGAVTDNSYMPTSRVLLAAPYTDTRRTAISDRYYK